MRKFCTWCRAPLIGKRSDAIYCGKPCRKARWRARIPPCNLARLDAPLTLAYADPPYPGKAFHYRQEPTYSGEVDIPSLLIRLASYDGWALSTSAKALPEVLTACIHLHLNVRVAAWLHRARPHKTARILNGWEPVIFSGGRTLAFHGRPPDPNRAAGDAIPLQVIDALSGPNPKQRPTLPTSCLGMKPPAFCRWIFLLLGALPGDTLIDVFPGSGIVTRAWLDYTGQEAPDVQQSLSKSAILNGEPK
jgi:hypothetical protein